MKCTNCGAGLSTDMLRQENCPYCGVAGPTSAKAVEHAAKVKELLRDADGDGIPDVVQGSNLAGDVQVNVQDGARVSIVTQHSSTQTVVEDSPSPGVPPSRPLADHSEATTKGGGKTRLLLLALGLALAGGLLHLKGGISSVFLGQVDPKACLIDANEDGVLDVAVGTGSPGGKRRATVLDGTNGHVLWKGQSRAQQTRVHCLSDDWFLFGGQDFDFDLIQVKGDRSTVNEVKGSDTLSSFGLGNDCIAYTTADGSSGVAGLESSKPSDCPTERMHTIYEQSAGVTDTSSNSSAVTVDNRSYTLGVRPRGTQMLRVNVEEDGTPVWSKELNYIKPTFSSGLAVAEGVVAVWGADPVDSQKTYLVGLDANTGEKLYARKYADTASSSVGFFAYNGRHLLIQWWGSLKAFDIRTGKRVWTAGG